MDLMNSTPSSSKTQEHSTNNNSNKKATTNNKKKRRKKFSLLPIYNNWNNKKPLTETSCYSTESC